MAMSRGCVRIMVNKEEKKKYPRKGKKDYPEKWPRTSATVWHEDLEIFKELANIKFSEDQMNNAWQEAVEMWISANINLYDKEAEEKKRKAEELKKRYQ
jgi:hypothetical protein